MTRESPRSRRALVLVVAASLASLSLASGWAQADDVIVNHVVATGETYKLPGSTGALSIYLDHPSGPDPNDPTNGCNAKSGGDGSRAITITVTSSDPARIPSPSTTLTFTRCGAADAQSLAYAVAPSATPGVVRLTATPTGGVAGSRTYAGWVDITIDVPTPPGTPSLSVGSNPGATGAVTIGWAASTNLPPTVPLTYTLQRRNADASTDVSETGLTSTSRAFAALSEGTWTFRARAVAEPYTTPWSDWSTALVVDTSAPNAPTLTPDRSPDFIDSLGVEWWRASVDVTTGSMGDAVLADGSAGSGVVTLTTPVTLDTTGTHEVIGTAWDAVGWHRDATRWLSVDATSPTVTFDSCPASVPRGSATVATWIASDVGSGLAGPASGSILLDTTTLGASSVDVHVVDNVGLSSSATCEYSVTGSNVIVTFLHVRSGEVYYGLLAPTPTCMAEWEIPSLDPAPTCSVAYDEGGGPSGSGRKVIRAVDGRGGSMGQPLTYYVTDELEAYGLFSPFGSRSSVKSGSTLPIKFAVHAVYDDEDGEEHASPVGSEDIFGFTAAASCGGTNTGGTSTAPRYSGNSGHFIYNWQSPRVTKDVACTITVGLGGPTALSGTLLAAEVMLKR